MKKLTPNEIHNELLRVIEIETTKVIDEEIINSLKTGKKDKNLIPFKIKKSNE